MKRSKRRKQMIYCVVVAILILMGLFMKKHSETADPVSGRAESVKSQSRQDTAQELPPRVALTFDDGPHPVYTKRLLEGLKERGVTATFFVVGENIPGNEGLIRQMEQDGHLIGNHTYDHADISKLSDEENCRELQKTEELIRKITGHGTAYVRPPFGNWKDSMDCRVSMISVKWTMDTLDWQSKNAAEIVNQTVKNAGDHEIILMHDYYASSVEAALEIVDRLTEKGYEFVTAEELILE